MQQTTFNIVEWLGKNRKVLFGLFFILALLLFELFNFSSTQYALTDILGDSFSFHGLGWATLLALGFCLMDFAGVARIFTRETDMKKESPIIARIFMTWMIAAGINATLTWWSVSEAIQIRQAANISIVHSEGIIKVIPVFVAVAIWGIRVLLIRNFSDFWDGTLNDFIANQEDKENKSQHRPQGQQQMVHNQQMTAEEKLEVLKRMQIADLQRRQQLAQSQRNNKPRQQ